MKKRIAKNKKSKNNWLLVGFVLLMFGIGIIAGMALGIKTGQMMLFEGLATALTGSHINFTININETAMADQMYKNLQPYLNKSFEELSKEK